MQEEHANRGFYIASSYRSSAITHSVKGELTGPGAHSIACAQCNRLQLFEITESGLDPKVDVTLNARIASLNVMRLGDSDVDQVLVTTEALQFVVLAYDREKSQMRTHCRGELGSTIHRMRPAASGQLCAVHDQVVALRLHDGELRFIPISESGIFGQPFSVRVEEMQILDMTFLMGAPVPILCVIYQDGCRKVKAYTISAGTRAIEPAVMFERLYFPNVHAIITVPPPLSGALFLSNDSVIYASSSVEVSVAKSDALISAHCIVDSDRILLGDDTGTLSMLFFEHSASGSVSSIRIEQLGSISWPSALAYIDAGVVFVGSIYGDSQLVRLSAEPIPDPHSQVVDVDHLTFVEVLETYSNIAPPIDFCVVRTERELQSQLVMCSGGGNHGSLRIVRNGVGIYELADIEMQGIQNVWSLSSATASPGEHDYLAIGFSEQTSFLALADEGLEGVNIPGASLDGSLCCTTLSDGRWIQVTAQSVRLIDQASLQLLSSWNPPNSVTLTACACTGNNIVVSSGSSLWLLVAEESVLGVDTEANLDYDVSCLDVCECEDKTLWCFVGLWTELSLQVFRLTQSQGLERVGRYPFESDAVARSVVMTKSENVSWVLCSLADGSLVSFSLEEGSGVLSGMQRTALGTQAASLIPFLHNGSQKVFAASERPIIINMDGVKLSFSSVDIPEAGHVCPFITPSFPGCLAISSSDGIIIGSVNDEQKIQVRTIPLPELPYRISHHVESHTFLVLLHGNDGGGRAILVDDNTFATLDTFELTGMTDGVYELPMSVLCAPFGSTAQQPSYFLGTAFMDPSEDESSRGRLIVLDVMDRKLIQQSEVAVDGAVFSIADLPMGSVVAGINSKVTVFSGQGNEDSVSLSLVPVCSYCGQVISLMVRTLGDRVAIGDLMRSITMLKYHSDTQKLEELAFDYHQHWMTSIEFVDESSVLGAENGFNVFTVHHSEEPPSGAQGQGELLDMSCDFHVGDFVNCIRRGSLASETHVSRDGLVRDSFLLTTQSGSLLTVFRLTSDEFRLLHQIITRIREETSGIAGLEHGKWRAFKSAMVEASEPRGFIDGDLIETFLNLPHDRQESIVSGLTYIDTSKDAMDGEGTAKPQPLSVESFIRFIHNLVQLY